MHCLVPSIGSNNRPSPRGHCSTPTPWKEFSIMTWFPPSWGPGHYHRKREMPLKAKLIDYEFERLGIAPSKAVELCTLWHVFPQVAQKPNEKLDVVPGQYLHFIQVPRHGNVNREIGLFEGYQITIWFDTDFKTMFRVDVKSACLTRLCKMGVLLKMDYPTTWGHR